MKAIGVRPHLVGDCVMSLIVAQAIRLHHPDAYFNWVVSPKCAQAAPLYIDHPAIDRILISTDAEGYGERERQIASACDVVFNPLPQHPEGDSWPQRRNIYEETWMMAGLPVEAYQGLPPEVKIPRLYQWFKAPRHPGKTVALWPGARQGEKENRRVPPYVWWNTLVSALMQDGYTVYHCGHPKEYEGLPPLGTDIRTMSFMDLIAWSLGCDAIIGTDSGSMVALAAYQSTPTLSLLSPHWPGHGEQNKYAFGPQGSRHTNMWAVSNEHHLIEDVAAWVNGVTV